jgi:hypothetical protein
METLDRRVNEPQSQNGRCAEEGLLPPPGFGGLLRNLLAVLTGYPGSNAENSGHYIFFLHKCKRIIFRITQCYVHASSEC